MGASDTCVLPALRKALHDSNPAVRRAAIWTACKIGPGAAAAVPDLVAQLATPEDWVAAEALGSIGPGAKAAVPALTDLLQRSKGYARLEAAEAIWKIDGNAGLAVPALITSLHEDYGPIRVEAAQMLGKIGPPAAKALPALKEMLEHKPQVDRSPPQPSGDGLPRPVQMMEAEFYPQIERAVLTAIDEITGAKRNH
jgi:HEAT repeat protein